MAASETRTTVVVDELPLFGLGHYPQIERADEVNAVNFDTDPFYVEPASVDDDMSDYDCSVTADVTLQMDFSDPALRSVASLCERERLSGMDFCSSDPDVSAALAQVITSCGIPG